MNQVLLLCFFLSLAGYVAICEGLSLRHELDSHAHFKNSSLTHDLEDALNEEENDELNKDNSSLDDIQHYSEPSLTESNQLNDSSDSGKNQSVLTSTQTSPNSTVQSKSTELTLGTSTKVSKTESQQQSAKTDSSKTSSTVTDSTKTSGGKPTVASADSAISTEPVNPDDAEKVVLGTRKTIVPLPKTVLQKTIDWMGDAYTLSILIPITAGVVFACTIISMIALCNCIRRRCRRRRLRRKALPDSVKSLAPSDRARLLAESTDEEF